MMAPMPLHSLRVITPIIVSALLTTACGTDATGECRGTYRGASVTWPIEGEASRWEPARTRIVLQYTPQRPSTMKGFGANVHLVSGASVRGTPVTIALSNEAGVRLAPEAGTLVEGWYGTVWPSSGSGMTSGFPSVSGVPMGGSVTLEAVNEDYAAGRYVYRYEDGSELTCTFNAPSPARAAGIWGGDGDDDDDDD